MTYQLMDKSEMKKCVSLAAAAFADYEYFATYVKGLHRRQWFLKSMLTTEFRLNADKEIFLTAKEGDRIVAVAILCPPGFEKPTDEEYLKNGFWKTVIYGGLKNVAAWNDMENAAIIPCRDLSDAWYLHMLVVEPKMKGKGIGSRMLQECIYPYVREHGGTKLCLYTNSESNRAFYTKNGLIEFDEKQFEYKGKTIGSWSYRIDL